ncbi:MAG: hypothetical protein M1819_004383 [Sarea resinae]|nr:MAG: hypothetical protein M1819_004383 [Sarea resinae]
MSGSAVDDEPFLRLFPQSTTKRCNHTWDPSRGIHFSNSSLQWPPHVARLNESGHRSSSTSPKPFLPYKSRQTSQSLNRRGPKADHQDVLERLESLRRRQTEVDVTVLSRPKMETTVEAEQRRLRELNELREALLLQRQWQADELLRQEEDYELQQQKEDEELQRQQKAEKIRIQRRAEERRRQREAKEKQKLQQQREAEDLQRRREAEKVQIQEQLVKERQLERELALAREIELAREVCLARERELAQERELEILRAEEIKDKVDSYFLLPTWPTIKYSASKVEFVACRMDFNRLSAYIYRLKESRRTRKLKRFFKETVEPSRIWFDTHCHRYRAVQFKRLHQSVFPGCYDHDIKRLYREIVPIEYSDAAWEMISSYGKLFHIKRELRRKKQPEPLSLEFTTDAIGGFRAIRALQFDIDKSITDCLTDIEVRDLRTLSTLERKRHERIKPYISYCKTAVGVLRSLRAQRASFRKSRFDQYSQMEWGCYVKIDRLTSTMEKDYKAMHTEVDQYRQTVWLIEQLESGAATIDRPPWKAQRHARKAKSSTRRTTFRPLGFQPTDKRSAGCSPGSAPVISTPEYDLATPDHGITDRSSSLNSPKASSADSSLKGEVSGDPLDLEDISSRKEEHLPLSFEIPEDVKRKAMLASHNTGAAYWQYSLYEGPDKEKVKVHYCRSRETTERVAQLFLEEAVLGFDIEWKPNVQASEGIRKNVSLVQLASESRIALFHIALFGKGDSMEDLVAPTMKQIMEDPNITKVGVSVKADCTRLRKFMGIEARGIFELSHLHKLVKYSSEHANKIDKRLVALAEQVQEHLQLPMRKVAEVRSSNWSEELNMQQILYAASDSYAGFRLYDVLERKRKELNPTPPRPAHAELNLPIQLANNTLLPTSDEPLEVEDDANTSDPSTNATTTMTSTSDSPPTTTTSTSSAAKLPINPLITAANTWAQHHRSTHPTAKTTLAPLRAYALWHLHHLDVPQIAAMLRDPPLQKATVSNYILGAIRAEGLPFERSRLRGVLGALGEGGAGRYGRLAREAGKEDEESREQ